MYITTGLLSQDNFQIEGKELPVQPKLKTLEIEFRLLNVSERISLSLFKGT